MSLVTVLTPTYNRKNELDNLFYSLQKQTLQNFEWLIVDDGSTDGTSETVNKFKENAKFPVKYVKKKNGGKHTALNQGIGMIETMLTIIVDSDDTLLADAMVTIQDYYEKYKNENKIGCFSFLRCKKNGTPIVKLSKDEFVDSYVKVRIKDDLAGDMAEVFYTSALKEFPFVEFENEKFLSEDVVWIQLGIKYKYVFVNKSIYQCEYLEGGLTDNDKPMKFASPLGSMMRGKMLMMKECGKKINIKGAIIYNCYHRAVCQELPFILKTSSKREKMLVALTYPLGIVYFVKWRIEGRKKH